MTENQLDGDDDNDDNDEDDDDDDHDDEDDDDDDDDDDDEDDDDDDDEDVGSTLSGFYIWTRAVSRRSVYQRIGSCRLCRGPVSFPSPSAPTGPTGFEKFPRILT